MDEFELISHIQSWIPSRLQSEDGIGNDAGLFTPAAGKCLAVTSDIVYENVDFILDPAKRSKPGCLTWRQAGRKAAAVNLSDMAAMGARPRACVVSLGLRPGFKLSEIRAFYQGLIELSEAYRVRILGGDISKSRDFFCSIAMMGEVDKRSCPGRSGARTGDWIAVTGSLGGSLKSKHWAFIPRVHEALWLSKMNACTSMMDVSDGLIQDLGHILAASNCGARLDVLEIPISADAVKLSGHHPWASFQRACSDGEDFELLFTVPAEKKSLLSSKWARAFPKVSLSWIGRITSQSRKIQWKAGGREVKIPNLDQSGYRHFK